MVTTLILVAYSKNKKDKYEVYHPDSNCSHRKKIEKNENALWHIMSHMALGARITVKGGRRLTLCTRCKI